MYHLIWSSSASQRQSDNRKMRLPPFAMPLKSLANAYTAPKNMLLLPTTPFNRLHIYTNTVQFLHMQIIKNVSVFRRLNESPYDPPFIGLTVIWHWANVLSWFGWHAFFYTLKRVQSHETRLAWLWHLSLHQRLVCGSCVFTCVHLTWFIRCVDVWYAPRTPSFRSCCIPTCSLGNKSLSLADSKEKQNTENYPLPVRGDACEILRICCFCRNTLSSVQFIKHRNWRGNIDTSTQEYSADFETGENETQITHSKINFGWNGMRWKSNCMLLMIIITNI